MTKLSFRSSPDELLDVLRQQCLDESGMYEWIIKRFRLVPAKRILEIEDLDTNVPIIRTGLIGAKYAKEWSISSNIAGFGFDIVWHSGKVWSFLCDTEVCCKNWVNRLNYTFSLISSNINLSNNSPPYTSQNEMNDMPTDGIEIFEIQAKAVPDYVNTSEYQAATTEAFQASDCNGIQGNTHHTELDSKPYEAHVNHNGNREVLTVESHTPIASSSQKQDTVSVNINTSGYDSKMNISNALDLHDLKAIQSSWDAEKTSMVNIHKREICRLEESEARAKERMLLAENDKNELSNKLSHLTSQMEKIKLDYGEVCTEQSSELENARQKYELQLIEEKNRMKDEIAVQVLKLQQEYSKGQSEFRHREKVAFDEEMDRVRNHYETRERSAAADRINLERLHSERVRELELRIGELRSKAEKRELHETDRDLHLQQIVKDHERQLELHSNNTLHLKEELEKLHTELQEHKTREEIYRSQMTELLEQNRLLQAEYVESRHQAEAGMSQAHQLRRVIRDTDLSESSRAVSLQIANDEINMLEHEVERLQNANQLLTDDLHRCESLVYGRVANAKAKHYSNNSQMQSNEPSKFNINKSVLPLSHAVKGKFNLASTSSKIARVTPVSKNSTSRSTKSNDSRKQQYKWRDGCTRSPLRCQGSSLVLLDAEDYEILDLHESHRPVLFDDSVDISLGSQTMRKNSSWRI